MLTPDMISAESISPALTDDQIENLTLLVETMYAGSVHLFSTQLDTKLAAEKATPTVKTKTLKAVLTQLNTLPAEVVESQGRNVSPTFFSTIQNWKSLALDVLTTFRIRVLSEHQSYALVQRRVPDLVLHDDTTLALNEANTGKRY